jgi:hypothetical protein
MEERMTHRPLNDDQIEHLIRQAPQTFTASPQTRESIRTRVLSTPPAAYPRRLTPWRFPMRLIIPTATAASILVAAILWLTLTATAPSAYAQLAEAVENTKQAGWMHIHARMMGVPVEMWASFRDGSFYNKFGSRITGSDGPTHRQYTYDGATNTLTIKYSDIAYALGKANNFFDLLTNQLAKMEDDDRSEITTVDSAEGRRRTVRVRQKDAPDTWVSVTFDVRAKRLVEMEARNFGPDGKATGVPTHVTFQIDYLQAGPPDIYALGVPRDAKVIDHTPSPRLIELKVGIERAKRQFDQEYVALVLREPRPGLPDAHLILKKGARVRTEWQTAHLHAPPLPEQWSLHRLAQWAISLPRREIAIYQGAASTRLTFAENGDPQVERQTDDPQPPTTVENYTWEAVYPQVMSLVRQEDNPFPQWIAVERFHQGRVYNGNVSFYPRHDRYWFDPERDHICRRYESVEDAQAPWQEDKDWLKDLPAGAKQRTRKEIWRHEVLELDQTGAGNWYVKRFKWSYGQPDRPLQEIVSTVYLDTSREIPDALFDPEQVDVAELFGVRAD